MQNFWNDPCIPQKRARFGIKIFFVCESKSGYAWDFFIYTGQGEEWRGGESNSQKPISHASVTKLALCPELIGKRYVVLWTGGFQVLCYSMSCSITVSEPVEQLTYEGRICQKNYRLLQWRKEMYFAIHQEFIQQSNSRTKKMWQYYPQFTGEEYVTQEKLTERLKEW